MKKMSGLEVKELLLSAVAEELERPQQELQQEIDEQGDLVIGSQRAVSIIAALEQTLGRRLAGVDELEPEEVTCFGALLRTLLGQIGGDE